MKEMDTTKNTNKIVEYPKIVFYSSYGHIPHLSSDLMLLQDFNNEDDEALHLHVDIGDMIQKSFGDLPFNNVIKRHSNNRLIYSPRHMKARESFVTSQGVSIDGPGGRRRISNVDYAKRIFIDKPYVAISMADHIKIPDLKKNALNSNDIKKARLAIERTNKWFDELKHFESIDWSDTKLFGVALAIPIIQKISNDEKICKYDITDPVKHLINNAVDGIVVGGSFFEDSLDNLVHMIKEVKKTVVENNTSDKYIAVMVQGARTLYDIAACVNAGADILSTSYPSDLSTKGQVMSVSSILASKKRKLDDVTTLKVSTVIDLNDSSFCEDILPLTPGCGCHCCSNHSRAYVHHLLKAKEMLAESLLQSHNHYQMLLLFKWIRDNKNEQNSYDRLLELFA